MFEENAIRNPDKTKADEAKQVKLYFMIPPIAKMDPAALSTLKACEHLALSTNAIDKIANLSGMENLKILSIGRNNIKKLENMDAISDRLEELWMSYNPIGSFAGIEKLSKLRVLFAGNCKIADKKELQRLTAVPTLEELVVYGNPLSHAAIGKDGELGYVGMILEILPSLRKIDGISVVEWKQKMSGGNENELKEIFAKMDVDGSGDVSLKELQVALSDDEICKYCKLKKENLEETFKAMDADGSGTVSWEEFKNHFGT